MAMDEEIITSEFSSTFKQSSLISVTAFISFIFRADCGDTSSEFSLFVG